MQDQPSIRFMAPLLDLKTHSFDGAGFFADEWTGRGAHGSTCYVRLGADGLG